MASRGSVIPLIIEQIKSGKPLTITDGNMTRFMMSINDAVDLVGHAFKFARSGDLLVKKAPAATILTLAKALKKIFKVENPIKIIGTRHGEKQHETLLTREEMMRVRDMKDYFCVSADNRDLNYDLYFNEGQKKMPKEDYNSNNTHILSELELIKVLMKVDYVAGELKNYRNG
jgi:UDP-glucose 4-epimerase